MPSGGFVESVMMGIPTFSFWDDKFIRCQPEAEKEVKKLIEVGIFNDNAKQMSKNIENCIKDNNWWNKLIRKESLEQFMSKYVKTDKDWIAEWDSLISSLDNNE